MSHSDPQAEIDRVESKLASDAAAEEHCDRCPDVDDETGDYDACSHCPWRIR